MTGKESGLPGTDSEMFKELEIQVRYIHIMLGVVIFRTYWKQCHLVYTYLVFENIIIMLAFWKSQTFTLWKAMENKNHLNLYIYYI